jgi:uncharacterized membrane protein
MQDPRRLQQVAGNLVALTRVPGASRHGVGQGLRRDQLCPGRDQRHGRQGGVLKPGALGDVVMWDGDPLEAGSGPHAGVIGGVEQDLTNHQTRLRDRYAYSLVALATFGWMAMAFRAVPLAPPLIEALTMSPAAWVFATLLMLFASVLLVGSFLGNPALPAPGAAALAAKGPHGVFHTTRHPMMWSMALWSVSHFLVSPTPRVLVLTLAVAVLALVGSHLQDRKKAVQMGAAWTEWEAKTGYWPRLGALGKAGLIPWLGGTVLWLGASWAHG